MFTRDEVTEATQWRMLHGAICGEVRDELQRFAEDVLQPKLSQFADRVQHDVRSELGSSLLKRVSEPVSRSSLKRNSLEEKDRLSLLHTPIMAPRFDEDLGLSRRSSVKRRTAPSPSLFIEPARRASLREAALPEANQPSRPVSEDGDHMCTKSSLKSLPPLKTRPALASTMAPRFEEDAGDLMGPKTSMIRRISFRCPDLTASTTVEPPPLPPESDLSHFTSEDDEEDVRRTPPDLPAHVPVPPGEPPGLGNKGPRKSRTMSTVFSADQDNEDGRSRRRISISIGSTMLGGEIRRVDTSRTSSFPSARKGNSGEERCSCCVMALLYISDFVASPWFERLGAAAIFCNTIYIGIATEYVASFDLSDAPGAFQAIEIIFLVIFFAEFALRVLVFGCDLFRWRTPEGLRNDQLPWNCLDCSIIVLQVVELLLGSAFVGIKVIRILRLMRLVRIVRLVKVMRFVADLRMIVCSIWRSISLFFWSLVALTMLNFICSVYFTEYVLAHKIENVNDPNVNFEDLNRYFGSLTVTMLSLFQAVTGGIDWGALTDVLKSETHYWVVFPFITYVAFSQIAMLNVISGVFLETAMEIAREEKEIYVFRNARVVFDAVDHAQTGHVSWPDFEASLTHPHMQHFFEAVDIRPSEARTLFNLLDVSGDGLISADEFLNGCLRVKGPAKALDLLILSREVSHLFEKHSEQRKALQENRDAIMAAMHALEGPGKDVEAIAHVLNTLENLTARTSTCSAVTDEKDKVVGRGDRGDRCDRCPSLIESKQLTSPRWDMRSTSTPTSPLTPQAPDTKQDDTGRPDSRRGRCRTLPLKIPVPGFQGERNTS